ncbi:MAG: hypothetical protein AABW72_01100 [archaeon]
MFEDISYMPIFGIPLIVYLGILTLTSFAITACLGMLVLRGKVKFKYHKLMAIISISIAVIHGSLGLLAYL